ncbi:MAG: glycerophosphodiester phosphodiesterase family protein [Chloroflexota bacterium]|nr:glycerophosphodiester phosphodiesterase family protein [Chloroflexota bacterium]
MNPKIYAHRGASSQAPENTLAAFQLAFEQGADGIELDVMLSKDQQLVVIHDDTVDRTTDGTGRVSDLTLAELKRLDAGEGEPIPTLAEVLDRFGGQFPINIELKNYSSLFDSLPLAVAGMVRDYGLADSILVSSFNPFNFPRFHRVLPDVPRGILIFPGRAQNFLYRLFRYEAFHPYFKDVDEALVKAVHARSQQINVWTVDEAADIRHLAKLGVDAIITNVPQRARTVLESLA